MAARTPEERVGAFVEALEVDILVVDDTEERTALTPPAELIELVAETRGEPTPLPPPSPLGPEARAFSERCRFVLLWHLGVSEEVADDVLNRVRELMPRGRR